MADEVNPQAPPPAPETPTPEAAPAPQAVPATSHQGSPRRREGGPPGRRMGGPGGRREGGPGAGPRRGKRQFFRKKKVCKFCVERVDYIDYKKPEVLQTFVQDRGKILPRRITGTCARHQRWLGVALRRARNIALLPFATEL